MVRKSFMRSVALAVLAAVGAMAVPAQAQDPDRQEWRAAAREARQQARAERQAPQQQAAAPQAAAPQEQAQATGGGRNWNRGGGDGNRWQGRGEARQQEGAAPSDGDRQARAQARQQERAAAAPQQRSAPEGGWRSQRAPDGQRYGRNWDNSGAVDRPAPAYRGATPQVPERGTADARQRTETRNSGEWATRRNRTYSDPNHNGAYGGRTYDRTAYDWRNQQGDRDRNGTHRNGYRDGRSADNYRDRRDQTRGYRDGYNGGYNGGYTSGSRDHHRWDRHDWRRDTRYNWSGYRNQHRDLYRAGRYYSPYNNYRYNRLSIGIFLDSGFYGNRYWINDPWQYRLPEVYGPYRWVRYYDDVLLVDIYSGEVVDVIHDFFW